MGAGSAPAAAFHLQFPPDCGVLIRVGPESRWHPIRQPGGFTENKSIMETQIEESVVIHKTRELCQTILDQPEFKVLRQRIDAFMANDAVRGQYDSLMVKGQKLQQKQQAGHALDGAEIDDFEKLRQSFLANPVAQGFLDAQEDMRKLQDSVSQYVSKTFELGRVPEESDLDSGGSCGHGCGCHH